MNDTKQFHYGIPTLCSAFGITPVEAQMLQVLLDEEIAKHKQLDYLSLRTRQLIHTLRAKLAEYKVEIISTRDVGYGIPLSHKVRLRNVILQGIATELKQGRQQTASGG